MMEIFQENVVLILILLETDNTNGKILEISIEVYIEKNKEMNKVIILNLHTVDLGVFNWKNNIIWGVWLYFYKNIIKI